MVADRRSGRLGRRQHLIEHGQHNIQTIGRGCYVARHDHQLCGGAVDKRRINFPAAPGLWKLLRRIGQSIYDGPNCERVAAAMSKMSAA